MLLGVAAIARLVVAWAADTSPVGVVEPFASSIVLGEWLEWLAPPGSVG